MAQQRRRGLIRFLNPFSYPIPNPFNLVPRFRTSKGSRKQMLIHSSRRVGTDAAVLSTTSSAAPPRISSTPSSSTSSSSVPSRVPLKPATDVIAGALARACSQTTIHPLDTLKVRLQAGIGSAVKAAPLNASKQFDIISMGRSVGSMYRGVFGAASGAGIAIGAYFAFYGSACNSLSLNTNLSPSAIAFSAGGIAAAGSSLVKVPLAVCIRSVQAGVYPNVFAAFSSIVAAAGPRGLFTGYLPTLLEDVPDMAIKFAGYESMRMLHSKTMGGRATNKQEDFAMGAIAGAIAAAVTTPLDVIKTNMMCMAASRPTVVSATKMVLEQGGPRAFFRGVGARAASNGINSAVFFCFFEAFRQAVKDHNAKEAVQMHVQPLSLDASSEDN